MVWEEAGRSSEGNSMNKWQQEIPTGPIQLAFGNCFDPMVIFFFVASSHWILLVSVRMQNYEMLSCVILLPWISQWSNWKSICRIAGTRDADVTSCFRMPLRGSNETVVKHVIPTSLQLCSGFFTICGLICFLPLGLWPPSTSKNLATLLPAFCMCQCAQVTSMVLMRHFWPLVCMRCPVWSSSLFPVSPGRPLQT